jgi:hypothetical protein
MYSSLLGITLQYTKWLTKLNSLLTVLTYLSITVPGATKFLLFGWNEPIFQEVGGGMLFSIVFILLCNKLSDLKFES